MESVNHSVFLEKLVIKNFFVPKPTTKGTQFIQMANRWQKIVDSLIPNNKVTIARMNDEGELRELSVEERDLLKKQKKNRLTVYSLRHTHASWMAISGKFSLLEIKAELGHKTTKMTERYSHLMPEDRHRKTNELFDSMT